MNLEFTPLSIIEDWNYFKTFCEIKGVEDLKLDFIWPQCALDDCQNFPLHTWSLKGCVREIRTRCNNKNLAKLCYASGGAQTWQIYYAYLTLIVF